MLTYPPLIFPSVSFFLFSTLFIISFSTCSSFVSSSSPLHNLLRSPFSSSFHSFLHFLSLQVDCMDLPPYFAFCSNSHFLFSHSTYPSSLNLLLHSISSTSISFISLLLLSPLSFSSHSFNLFLFHYLPYFTNLSSPLFSSSINSFPFSLCRLSKFLFSSHFFLFFLHFNIFPLLDNLEVHFLLISLQASLLHIFPSSCFSFL